MQIILSRGNVHKDAVLQHVRVINPTMMRPLIFRRIESMSTAGLEENGFESTKVSDILKAKGKCADRSWPWCTTDDTVYDVVISMTHHNVGALVVVKPEEDKAIAGIINEREFNRKQRMSPVSVGLHVTSKAAFNEGMSTFVFIFYRQTAATLLLAPVAIIFERKSFPLLTPAVLLKMFMLSLIGITFSSNIYNVGLRYTSATVTSACTNSVPVITFFVALLLRMENLNIKKLSGLAKILGVTFCFSGIMTIAFYTGPRLNPLSHHQLFSHRATLQNHTQYSKATWIKGTFFVITSNTTWSLWLVLQGLLLREYPSKLLLITFQSLFSTIQSFFVALAFVRDINRWYLSLNTGLLAIAYCGFVVTGTSYYLRVWCIEKRGPVFIAMFTPLAYVFTMFCSSSFLGEIINLGSVLGGTMMVGGLYVVLWGKNKETSAFKPTIEDGEEIHEEKEVGSPFRPL